MWEPSNEDDFFDGSQTPEIMQHVHDYTTMGVAVQFIDHFPINDPRLNVFDGCVCILEWKNQKLIFVSSRRQS